MDNRDLIDLCRLNLLEENIKDSPALDRDATLYASNWRKRQLLIKIQNQQAEIADGVMKRHLERNTVDGKYPPYTFEND